MDKNQPFVITISREMGSGGHTIGKKLAEKLGVRFCDKQVMHQLMKEYGLTASEIERIKAKKKSWLGDFFDRVAPVARSEVYLQSSASEPAIPGITADDILTSEKEILSALVAEGSCVVAGRAAFAILKDHPNKIDVFIRSTKEKRIQRVAAKQGLTPEQAESLIDSIDEGRENYVKRLCGRSRYDIRNYDLVLNAAQFSEEQILEEILKLV